MTTEIPRWLTEDVATQCEHTAARLTPGAENTLEEIASAYANTSDSEHNCTITLTAGLDDSPVYRIVASEPPLGRLNHNAELIDILYQFDVLNVISISPNQSLKKLCGWRGVVTINNELRAVYLDEVHVRPGVNVPVAVIRYDQKFPEGASTHDFAKRCYHTPSGLSSALLPHQPNRHISVDCSEEDMGYVRDPSHYGNIFTAEDRAYRREKFMERMRPRRAQGSEYLDYVLGRNSALHIPEPKLAACIAESNAAKKYAEKETGNPDQTVTLQDLCWYEREVESAIKEAQKLNEKIKRKMAKRKDFPILNPNMDAETRERAYKSHHNYHAAMNGLRTLAAGLTFDLCKLRGITAEGTVTRAKLDKNLETMKETRGKVDALTKLCKLL
jgi:hypothetical protein